MLIKNDNIYVQQWFDAVIDDETDVIIKEGSYDELELTDKLPLFINEPCNISKETTLRDFFKLLDKHRYFLSQIIGNQFTEYLDYGLCAIPYLQEQYIGAAAWDYMEISATISYRQPYVYKHDIYTQYCDEDNEGNLYKTKYFSKGDKRDGFTWISTRAYGVSLLSRGELTETSLDIDSCSQGISGETRGITLHSANLPLYMDKPIRINHRLQFDDTISPDIELWKISKNFNKITLIDVIQAIWHELALHDSLIKAWRFLALRKTEENTKNQTPAMAG